MIKPCRGCKRDMRPLGTHVGDYPGTVPHKGQGMCARCVVRGVKAGSYTPRVQSMNDPLVTDDSGLQGFLIARRKRGVPACGYQNA